MAPADTAPRRIAEKGREALRDRLRVAFEEAATAHADVLVLDPERLERMVNQAVRRADGLQWRRALAAAATEELGIELGEALEHPAVVRAQQIVGAPSYEEGLAAIAAGKPPPPGSGEPPEAEDESPKEEPEETQANEPGFLIRLAAVHAEGLPGLENQAEVVLEFSGDELRVLAGGGELLGSLDWDEIDALDVQPRRGRLRRSRGARVTVSARGHEGKFDVADGAPGDLAQRLAPVRSKLAEREQGE
jgi:hypothetical protein